MTFNFRQLIHFAQLLAVASFPLWLIGCNSLSPVEDAMQYAGKNTKELQELLTHYADDTLKHSAAEFLIGNMQYHYSIQSDSLLPFYVAIDSINRTHREAWNCRPLYDSVYNHYKTHLYPLKRQNDITHITSDFLIAHIDHSFRVWQEGSWATHVSFADFCEYILPYRIGNEPLELWGDTLEKQYALGEDFTRHTIMLYEQIK